jgi:tRNA(Ile)-lysidine synthase
MLHQVRFEEFLRAGERVGVAVSGGIDSVALLRLLVELDPELGVVVSVVHFNHQLRGAASDADQEFVAGLAREYGLEFYGACGDAARLAAGEHSGVEAAARELRYGFFRRLLGSGEASEFEASPPPAGALNKIVTGHTLDDQAETVLMRMIRGTGLRGLGGIYPRIVVGDEDGESQGEIIRPLLGIRRRELEQYLKDLKQPWREDSSNADYRFTRNRVRSMVLPLLEREFNPAVAESLAELAEIARDEQDYWENEISGWLGTVVQWSQPEWTRGLPEFGEARSLVQIQTASSGAIDAKSLDPELLQRLEEPGPALMNASVSRPWLLTEPRAVQRRVIKAVSEEAGVPLEFKHIEEILRFAAEDGPPGKELSLPLGWKVVREAEAIVFVTPDLRGQERIPDYEYSLPLPGRVVVAELGTVIEAIRSNFGARLEGYNSDQLLRADLLPGPLSVRNWRAGDRFWPAHTKVPKKIKELLQERHVAQPQRRLWPVVATANEIVWMRGFPVPARLRAEPEKDAVLIRESIFAEAEDD